MNIMFDPSPSNSWPKRFAEAYEKTLSAASDTQIILSLAYWVNFYLDGKCELSAYHYTLAIDTGLIALSTFVASTVTIRNYYKTPLAASLRYCCFITVLVLIGLVLHLQLDQRETFEQWPTFKKDTSAIFLPASCFLNADFQIFASNDYQNAKDQLGNPRKPLAPLYIFFAVWNGIILVMGFIRNYWRSHFDQIDPQESESHLSRNKFVWIYRFVAVLGIFVTSMSAWTQIVYLRIFASKSGWIQLNPNGNNPEDNVGAIGQLVPLFSLLTIFLTFAGELVNWSDEPDPTAGKRLGKHDRELYDLSSPNYDYRPLNQP